MRRIHTFGKCSRASSRAYQGDDRSQITFRSSPGRPQITPAPTCPALTGFVFLGPSTLWLSLNSRPMPKPTLRVRRSDSSGWPEVLRAYGGGRGGGAREGKRAG